MSAHVSGKEKVQLARLALEEAPIGIAVVALDGTFLRVNRALCEIVGYGQEELTRLTFQAITHPDDVDTDVALAQKLAAGEIPRYQLTKRYIRKDGEVVDIMLSAAIARAPDGAPLYFISHIEDITERKRAEDRVRQLEERYELALRGADLAVWDWNILTGDVAVNPRWAEMRGFSPDEMKHDIEAWFAAIHPDDVAPVRQRLYAYIDGNISEYEVEYRARTKQGTYIWILDRGKAFARDPRGRPTRMAGTELDISARKHADEALRMSEARASGILAVSADAIISLDDDYRIVLFNAGAEKIFGYSKDEVLGGTLDVLLPERFRARHRAHFQSFATSNIAARRMGQRSPEIVGRRRTGDEFPADATISKIDVGGSRVFTVALRDVSEQVRVEREQRFLADAGTTLAESLEYEETLARVAQLAVREIADTCIVDIVEESGEVRRLAVVSRHPHLASACQRLKDLPFTRSGPPLSAQTLRDKRSFLYSDLTRGTLAAFAQDDENLEVLRTLSPRSVISVPLLAYDKLVGVMVLISSSQLRTYDTDDVHFAEELARRAALSIESARLYRSARRAIRARDDVLAIVAHDLRNPLATMRLQAQTLELFADEDDDEIRDATQRIERAANRMERLIEDMLDVSRLEAGTLRVHPATISAADITTEAVEAQQALAEHAGITLSLDVQADHVDVIADRDRVAQVLENLIGNALKFTKAGGRIVVGAARRGPEMEIWVRDDGIGMSSEAAQHVFDRFWQVRDTDRRGAGLGLAIAKGIVEAHDGRIWVESVLGRGTTVRFTLPVAARHDVAATAHLQ